MAGANGVDGISDSGSQRPMTCGGERPESRYGKYSHRCSCDQDEHDRADDEHRLLCLELNVVQLLYVGGKCTDAKQDDEHHYPDSNPDARADVTRECGMRRVSWINEAPN